MSAGKSASGTWLDTKTNKVVTSKPEEGVQLVAPGVEATPDELANLDRVKASLAPAKDESHSVAEAADVKVMGAGTSRRPAL